MEDSNSFVTCSYAGKASAVFWVGSSRRLKNNFISHEVAIKSEEEVTPKKHVKRAFPRPLSDEDFFPVHFLRLVGIVNSSSEVLDKIWLIGHSRNR